MATATAEKAVAHCKYCGKEQDIAGMTSFVRLSCNHTMIEKGESFYKLALDTARLDYAAAKERLAEKQKELAELEKEINRLNRVINELGCLLGEGE